MCEIREQDLGALFDSNRTIEPFHTKPDNPNPMTSMTDYSLRVMQNEKAPDEAGALKTATKTRDQIPVAVRMA